MSEKRIEGEDWSGARIKNVNLSGAKFSDVLLTNASISGETSGLKIHDIEVEPLIEAELERRYPERKELFAADPEGVRRAWTIVEDQWASTIERARALPEETLHEQVDEEWSLVETMRHMIMVIDAWIGRTVLGRTDHFHPFGLPPSFLDPALIGVDADAKPSFEEAHAVWRERMDEVRELIDGITQDELDRTSATNEARGYPPVTEHKVIRCLWTTIGEAWAHNRFANRDLDTLTS